ncbi:hypothetical protein UC8_28000 [Roseimaritima ulvae]|uniref:Uncharacterized protein n=1 Tax=Roseimaritima ulvae TaxID=980254 RepID=A0A5B9QS51_9BACT|nr:hypothetical protein UC8_28000 [Roseimaritima ulvae]
MAHRIPLLIFMLMLCPSLVKAGVIVHSQKGPSISQASGAASIPSVVPHGDRERDEHIQYAIPVEGLATSPSPSSGSVVLIAALAGVATPSPMAELRWQISRSDIRLPQTPHYRSLLRPS